MSELKVLSDFYGEPVFDVSVVFLLFLFTYILTYLFVRLADRGEKDVEKVAKVVEKPKEIEKNTLFEKATFTGPKEIKDHETVEATKVEDISSKEGPFVSEKPLLEFDKGDLQTLSDALGEETVSTEIEKVVATEEVQSSESQPQDLFSRLRKGLSKTHAGLFGKLDHIFSRKEIDSDLWEEFEEILITADIGVSTTMKLRENIESRLSKQSLNDPSKIKEALKEEIKEILKKVEAPPIDLSHKPTVIMVAGANGVGKTTTIGKLAYKFRGDGRKVMIAAADTFRAAAVEQLEVWAQRVRSDFIKASKGADPSSVAFDALESAIARGSDVVIVDTAGRLHTKANLMQELSKIKRVIQNKIEGAPHEVLLVLDATTGQNAIQQAKMFKEAIDVTGIVVTKLDGTAKGGVIVAIADELGIPVKYIGIGERLDDLREFNAEEFVEALFLSGEETLH